MDPLPTPEGVVDAESDVVSVRPYPWITACQALPESSGDAVERRASADEAQISIELAADAAEIQNGGVFGSGCVETSAEFSSFPAFRNRVQFFFAIGGRGDGDEDGGSFLV
jgi:hypothetical protein